MQKDFIDHVVSEWAKKELKRLAAITAELRSLALQEARTKMRALHDKDNEMPPPKREVREKILLYLMQELRLEYLDLSFTNDGGDALVRGARAGLFEEMYPTGVTVLCVRVGDAFFRKQGTMMVRAITPVPNLEAYRAAYKVQKEYEAANRLKPANHEEEIPF